VPLGAQFHAWKAVFSSLLWRFVSHDFGALQGVFPSFVAVLSSSMAFEMSEPRTISSLKSSE